MVSVPLAMILRVRQDFPNWPPGWRDAAAVRLRPAPFPLLTWREPILKQGLTRTSTGPGSHGDRTLAEQGERRPVVKMIVNRPQEETEAQLRCLLEDRILVLDGAMGTMVQALNLTESDARGRRFADHPVDLQNFVDILSLTQPDAVTEIHGKYLDAGADIITTNTFGSSPVGMEEFRLPPETMREINAAAVECARRAVEICCRRQPGRPRFIAGSIGPTAKQTAISTQVDDPGYRGATFDQMAASYYQQVAALVEVRCRSAPAGDGHRHAQSEGLPVCDSAVFRRGGASRAGDGVDHLQ